MDIGHAVLKGILQGLTEFLPVSSTAHLIFIDALAKTFGWNSTPPLPGEEEFYDIMLHMGTLGAVLYYFRTDLWQILQIYTGKLKPEDLPPQPGNLNLRAIPVYLGVSICMTVGLVLLVLKGSEVVMSHMGLTGPGVSDISEYYLAHPQFVAFHLIITGCLLFFTEQYANTRQVVGTGRLPFNVKNSFIVGLAQGCAAIFHGISRSGSTISAGLASGLDRLTATRYSFLLSIPTFMMAAVYETLKLLKHGHVESLNWPAMLLGTLLSGIVGYICVKYFIQFVARHSLHAFSLYCWAVGLGMLVFLSFNA